jgi:CheY-like chemotaxis protein
VTDYAMPEMDGIEFIRRASKIAPRAVFIMISGNNLEPLEPQLSRLKGLKMRLQKPFGWRPLADAVLQVWPGKNAPSYRV